MVKSGLIFNIFSKIFLINISITDVGLVDTIVGNFVEIHQALHDRQTFVKTYFLRSGNPETDRPISNIL